MSQEMKYRYELVVLFRPDLEQKMDSAMKIITDLVEQNDGEVVKDDNWGRKELAYKIAGETHAIYHVLELNLPVAAPAKIDSVLNITDGVIRHLIVRINPKVEAEIAAEKKARAAREAARNERDHDKADK